MSRGDPVTRLLAYWVMTFLTIPTLVWGFVGPGRSRRARVAGAVAILATGLELGAVALLSARSVGVGLNVIWYVVLGLNTGMFQWQGSFLTSAVIVLGLRFLALQLTATTD